MIIGIFAALALRLTMHAIMREFSVSVHALPVVYFFFVGDQTPTPSLPNFESHNM